MGIYDLLLRWLTTYYNRHPTTAKKGDLGGFHIIGCFKLAAWCLGVALVRNYCPSGVMVTKRKFQPPSAATIIYGLCGPGVPCAAA